jgi:peptide/nickel transport system substrate-binding protein
MDEILLEALRTVDDAAREDLLQQASRMAMDDYAIIPLHYEVTPWAMRAAVDYTPRADQYTLPFLITPVE